MYNSDRSSAAGVLALGVIALTCFLIGLLPATAVEGGPAGVVILGGIVSAVLAVIVYFAVHFVIEYRSDSAVSIARIFAGCAFAVTMLPSGFTYLTGHGQAAYVREMAPEVRAYGLEFFNVLDTSAEGVISEEELETSLSRLNYDDSNYTALSFISSNKSDVGHVVGQKAHTTFVWQSTGKGTGYMRTIITYTNIYAISRGDLETFPDRMNKKWKHW